MKKKSYILLLIFLILNVAITPLFIPNGGLVGDIQHYIRIAYYLPEVKWSLYPLGYPLLLRAFYSFTGDYYWAGRIINMLCFLGIGLFAYKKNFHFKETVILLCTKIFVYAYFNILSEGVFLCLMYFLFYYFYQYFYNKRGKQLVIAGSVLMILLFTVRYSALYIYLALAVYYVFYYYFRLRKQGLSFFRTSYSNFLLISGIGIFLYISFNYMKFGDLMGESFRNPSDLKPFTEPFYIAVLGFFMAFDPFFAIKAVQLTPKSILVESIFLIINLSCIWYFIRICKKYFKKTKDFYFYGLIIFIGISYLLLIFLSSFYQGIDNMDMRILSEGSFCIFYVFIFIVYKEKHNETVIFILAVLCLAFNTVYAIKIPKFYLTQKKETESELAGVIDGKKYFYNDTAEIPEMTTYKIPLIGKEIKKSNPYSQSGFINAYIIMTKYPEILELRDEKSIVDKKLIIYNSDLKNAHDAKEPYNK